MADSKFDSICVTSDLLKIDHRAADKLPNPQRINMDWLEKLVAEPISNVLGGIEIHKRSGDEGNARTPRWTFYSQCGLPLDSNSWAFLYEGFNATDKIGNFLDEYFDDGKLIVSFEAPDYLINYLNSRGLRYIDFTIHPIRFLPDYMFGIRTNVDSWRQKLAASSIPDDIIRDFARVSAARTMRIYRQNMPKPESALFLGQIEVDASLIHNSRLATLEDVEQVLFELSVKHQKVYYKVHPHLKDQKGVKKTIASISNCEWINVNIYDAFGCGIFDTVATLSSGGAIEARYFDCKSQWFLDRFDYTHSETTDLKKRYYPIYQFALERPFWNYLLDDAKSVDSFSPIWPTASSGAFKFSLNQKWGR